MIAIRGRALGRAAAALADDRTTIPALAGQITAALARLNE